MIGPSRAGPPRTVVLWLCVLAGLGTAGGGCVSGRVLKGYPGYPFASFETEQPADSTFFALQPALVAEGFPLDYTIRDEGYITTRSAEMLGRPVFLNLVVEPVLPVDSTSSGVMPQARVWLAAYEQTVTGAERVNPLQEQLWAEVMELAGRLSTAVGGSSPVGPASSQKGSPGE